MPKEGCQGRGNTRARGDKGRGRERGAGGEAGRLAAARHWLEGEYMQYESTSACVHLALAPAPAPTWCPPTPPSRLARTQPRHCPGVPKPVHCSDASCAPHALAPPPPPLAPPPRRSPHVAASTGALQFGRRLPQATQAAAVR